MSWIPLAVGTTLAAAVVGGRALTRTVRSGAWKKSLKAMKGSGTKKFYEGGFEDPMSRREAALILGCRESSSKQRVNERYRKLMQLNHPDAGGSPHLTIKINEAKVLLLKRAQDDGTGKGVKAKARSRK